ncbi:uncharacterized protein NPIL_469551 [Nephila pilipes]|uniref:Uncharacterized protein n=1 Tax=Nephila pilipes TaxID=299642 RepID=A0A8X6NH43_NEPPI|nr:uncharacterized protein NPIL_469551 [Nephila pilipes]
MVFNFASNNSQITLKGGRVDLVTSSHNKRRFRVNGSWYLSWCLSLYGAQRRRAPRSSPSLSKLPPLSSFHLILIGRERQSNCPHLAEHSEKSTVLKVCFLNDAFHWEGAGGGTWKWVRFDL